MVESKTYIETQIVRRENDQESLKFVVDNRGEIRKSWPVSPDMAPGVRYIIPFPKEQEGR